MAHELTKVSFCNMCMIRDKATGKLLVLDKQDGSWRGTTFPGGHIEKGESVAESVIREVREETGLTIRDPQPCGMVDWCRRDTGERYLVLLYRTEQWEGTLVERTEEGCVCWMLPEQLRASALAPNMGIYFEQFLSERYTESFALWDEQLHDKLQII